MENAALMRVVNGASQGRHQLRQVSCVHRHAAQVLPQIGSLDQLHAQEALVVQCAEFVDRNNVRVIEFCGGFCFDLETLDGPSRGQMAVANHFERDESVEADLASAINHPHAAAGDLIENFVIAEEAGFGCRGFDAAIMRLWESSGQSTQGARLLRLFSRLYSSPRRKIQSTAWLCRTDCQVWIHPRNRAPHTFQV